MQELANERRWRRNYVLINVRGGSGHCDRNPYDLKSYEMFLRNGTLANTDREYLEWAKSAF